MEQRGPKDPICLVFLPLAVPLLSSDQELLFFGMFRYSVLLMVLFAFLLDSISFFQQ